MTWTDLTNPHTLTFAFDNLALNLGEYISNFIKPIVSDIQQYTQPLTNVLNTLSSPIPYI